MIKSGSGIWITLPSGKRMKIINPLWAILMGLLSGVVGGLLATACAVLA